VGVHAETRSRCDAVVIENPQRAEMDPLGIVIIRKTEGVCGLEPAVVEIAAGVCFVNDIILHTIADDLYVQSYQIACQAGGGKREMTVTEMLPIGSAVDLQ